MKPYEQKLIALRQEMDMIDDNIIGALSGRIDCVGEQYSPIFVYEQQRLSICKKIAQILDIYLAGFDIITKDINKAFEENSGVINEVNTAPGIEDMYVETNSGTRVHVAEIILKDMFNL